jgi:eukaryotic-like serine/threonine-protein kinase
MIGRTISHYRVIEKLGEGGMGIVYKAEDAKLKRPVALKFLLPQAFENAEHRERFIREAQTAAVLDHPNICTIFEIDEAEDLIFIAMAFVEGESLKDKIKSGPLRAEEALDVAAQVAPEISKTTRSVGTAAYMSPEQGRGAKVDHRTDIWSLGVVMYELLAGELPFKGEYDAAVVYSLVNEDPAPIGELRPDLPDSVRRIVERAMEKSPEDRFQTAAEMLASLRSPLKWVGTGRGGRKDLRPEKSIVVLSFADVSRGRELEYLCDGIAEEIIGALTKVEGIRVVARTSAFSFKGKNEDIRTIARKLNVDAVLEGSVRKADNRLRINAQLINAADGYHLWSERYDRQMEDVFAIQDEITLAIVNKLKVTLLGGEREALVKRSTEDVEAYNLYLKGRYFWNKRTETGYLKSLEYFRQAIDKDPTYAVAYAGIADSYDLLGWYGSPAPEEAFPRARAAAEKARELDPTLAEAHASLGWISANYDWDWTAAEGEYKRALELNSSYATAHQWYSEFLTYMGRHDESIAEGHKAQELDPLSIIINNDVGQVYYFARRYDEAIAQLRKTLEMDPDFAVAHYLLGLALAQKSQHDEAVEEGRIAATLAGEDDALILSQLGVIYAVSGRDAKARQVLAELDELSREKYASPFPVALVHAGLGDNDSAFEWLGKACEKRDHWVETLKVHPVLDGLRGDERYSKLLRATGLGS